MFDNWWFTWAVNTQSALICHLSTTMTTYRIHENNESASHIACLSYRTVLWCIMSVLVLLWWQMMGNITRSASLAAQMAYMYMLEMPTCCEQNPARNLQKHVLANGLSVLMMKPISHSEAPPVQYAPHRDSRSQAMQIQRDVRNIFSQQATIVLI